MTSSPLTTRLLAGLVALALVGVVPVAAQNDKSDKSDKDDKATQTKAQPAAGAPKGAKLPSTTGIVLRPKEVDGSVSAYAAAVRTPDPNARVYTNADLERLLAGDTGPWATEAGSVRTGDEVVPPDVETPLAMDPLEYLESKRAGSADRENAIAEAERELATARAEVSNLEKQLLQIRNPFAARPDVSDEEKAARANDKGVAERLARAEEQLEQARRRVSEAEQKLNRARR